MSTKGSARDLSLDLIRVVAIILVVVEHSSLSGQLALRTLGALGVPLFVILTGYLMVGRDYENGYMAQYLKRNLLPLVVCYQVWNLLYFLLSHLTFLRIKPVRFKAWLFSALFMGRTWDSLWFLPMIIGLYLGLPLISLAIHRFAKDGNRTYLVVLGVCIIVFGTLVPTLQEVYGLFFHGVAPIGTFDMNVFGSYVWGGSVWILYLCVGYYLKKRRDDYRYPMAVILLVVCFAGLYLLNRFKAARKIPWSPSYSDFFLVVVSICLFIVLTRIGSAHVLQKASCRIGIMKLSQLSFGVYMVHLWVMVALGKPNQELLRTYGDVVVFLGRFAVYYLVSVLVVWVLSLIPPIRRWLLLIKDPAQQA